MSSSSILDMRVHLYDGHHDKEPSEKPEWTGTLNQFWQENQDGYVWGDIRALGEKLLSPRRGVRIGGGAAAEFTLFREYGVPDGWDVAEGGARAIAEVSAIDAGELAKLRTLNGQLKAALGGLLSDVEADVASPGAYGYPVEDEQHPYHESVLAARAALAQAEGRA